MRRIVLQPEEKQISSAGPLIKPVRSLARTSVALLLLLGGLGAALSTSRITWSQATGSPQPSQSQPSQSQPELQPRPQYQPQSGTSQPTATLSATTREVLLDVVVTDSAGHPVTGLTASDFTVSEDGDAQRIAHLEEHRPMSAADVARLQTGAKLPPNTFTNFTPIQNTNASTVILLDALDTPIQSQMQLREQLIDYLKHMAPGTPIAIFQIDTEMRLIQGFSSDPQVLLDAAKSKRDMPSLAKPATGNGEIFRRFRRDILRAGFRAMGRYLAAYPGRKSLIWFTGQIPEDYLTHPLESSFGRTFRDDFSILNDDPSNPNDLTDALTLSRVAVYPVDARGLETSPQFDVSRGGRPSMGAGRRFDSMRAFQHMDLSQIAEQTGGKAYYNTNGLKETIAEVVSNGSSYYTLAYSTTNQKWEGQFRHIKLKVDKPGVNVQYRQGYYAFDRAKQEQRLLAAMQKKQSSADPFADTGTESEEPKEPAPGGADTASAQPTQSAQPGQPTAGAVTPKPKGGFEASMQLGAIPPTEVTFTAVLSIDDKVVKIDKSEPLPPGNFLKAEWKSKPFRTYNLQIRADAHALHLTRTADGKHQGKVVCVTVVYDPMGRQVNSIMSSADLALSDATYRQMLAGGMILKQQVAVPVKGNYFLRVGVHDLGSDRVGALEIPVDEVHAGVADARRPQP